VTEYQLPPDNWRNWPKEFFECENPAPDEQFYLEPRRVVHINLWASTDDQAHVQIVTLYFRASGQFDQLMCRDRSPGPQFDPLWAGWGRKMTSDK
jgi:hypothetical protein